MDRQTLIKANVLDDEIVTMRRILDQVHNNRFKIVVDGDKGITNHHLSKDAHDKIKDILYTDMKNHTDKLVEEFENIS